MKLKLVTALQRASATVSLAELIEAKIIPAPIKLFRRYKGTMLEAQLTGDGTIEFRGSFRRSLVQKRSSQSENEQRPS